MPQACPFRNLPPERNVAENDLACATPDAFPANPGHTLIVPRRHVAIWFYATLAEQTAILMSVARVKDVLDGGVTPH